MSMTKEEFRERLEKEGDWTPKEINKLITSIDEEIKNGCEFGWEYFLDFLLEPLEGLKGVVIRRYRINEEGHLVDEEVTL